RHRGAQKAGGGGALHAGHAAPGDRGLVEEEVPGGRLDLASGYARFVQNAPIGLQNPVRLVQKGRVAAGSARTQPWRTTEFATLSCQPCLRTSIATQIQPR